MGHKILLVSAKESFLSEIQKLIGSLNYSPILVQKTTEIDTLNFSPQVVIIDFSVSKAELKNIYDAVWKKFKTSKIIVLFENKLPFPVEEMGTRRLSMAFVQKPFETDLLIDYLLSFAPINIQPEDLKFNHLTPIRLSDIKADEKFKFDIFFYMPINKKCLLYRKRDSTMTSSQIKKFQDSKVHDLYIRKTDLKAFNDYATKRIKFVLRSKEIAPTEKRYLLQKKVKDLFGSFFDEGSVDARRNQAILNTCKQVVGQLISEISPHPEIIDQLLHYTAQIYTNYSHAINVSVYSSLFALALGNEDLEAAAIGGMLHDIGLSSLPLNVASKNYSALSDEEKKVYQTHNAEGLKLLNSKKIKGSETIGQIIEQHHELMDGTGYPKGLKKEQLSPIVRITQIADEFDNLTSVQSLESSGPMSPMEAMLYLFDHNVTPAGGERFDGEMLFTLKNIFCTPTKVVIDFEGAKQRLEVPAKVPVDDTLDPDVRRRKRYKKHG